MVARAIERCEACGRAADVEWLVYDDTGNANKLPFCSVCSNELHFGIQSGAVAMPASVYIPAYAGRPSREYCVCEGMLLSIYEDVLP